MQGFEAAQHRALSKLAERAPAVAAAIASAERDLAASAGGVLAVSDFVLDALCRDPKLWQVMLRAPELGRAALPLPALPPADAGLDATQEALFMASLRRWRRAEFARIAWRDLAQWANLDETLASLSGAAEAALRLVQQFAERALRQRYGEPRGAAGAMQQLIIVAMGKLGGGELNFSSDIDLVPLYVEAGETDGARSISNQEFFTRLVQQMIRLLGQQTDEGFVFRVDLRLRPFGDSGPVVANAAALEDYLQIHGRDWERYAWVKARPITNEPAFEQLFRSAIRPFVYRRYLDFGIFESLREMKGLIEREVLRRDLDEDIKLGEGGIREIEFIVQSFQLIRGGQDRRLQGSSLRHALPLLAGAKLLPAAAVAELDAAYVFLRRLENRLQMRADQQQHRLPDQPYERERLAWSMGCAEWPQLAEQLAAHRANVTAHFRAVVFGDEQAQASVPPPLPLGAADSQALDLRLAAFGSAAPAAAASLQQFHEAAWTRRLDKAGARRLYQLLPVLALDAAPTPEPLRTLQRLLRVLEAIGARSAYFALLAHNGPARARLVRLAAHGDYLIEQIAAHPLLLDELIDQRLLEQPPDRAAFAFDLAQRMDGADEGDQEQLLERLRQFQRAAIFRLAVADLLLQLPVMQVSDRLTDIAELIVERALNLTWAQLTPTLGVPRCGEGAARRDVHLCVVGYGKLGGMELGYSSDLDLVFLHDSSGAQQHTDGHDIDNQVFFLRFAQRMVHLLTVHSAAGRLYEVDMRLRPSGKAGLLITSIDAFGDYQRREAWTWEHQALLHARAVAGPAELMQQFEAMRAEVLALHVRRESLREDVRHMRNRQRRELSRAKPGEFDLKQDPGGIGDIEFLAQYWALLWAREYPPVAFYADTIRQLESVASADLVPQALVDRLTGIYRAYRTRLHHRALDGRGAMLDVAEFSAQRATVTAIWDEVMGA
jgi:[glutamine synthetase] adenylyltransferase / [glutamine synthetase]-adenylyl-L-tyrosine phosphorylase